jgi:hypothetical protein
VSHAAQERGKLGARVHALLEARVAAHRNHVLELDLARVDSERRRGD